MSILEDFELLNSERAWFVAGYAVDTDTPEGFVYGDFTTDMCWTCYVQGRKASIRNEKDSI